LLVVTGTGTGIGKTHVSVALCRVWGVLDKGGRGIAGLKPVETGMTPNTASDSETLEQASTFHVKRYPPPYMLRRAVSPHLAAADDGIVLQLEVISTYVNEVRRLANGVVLELPGGLFTPLAPKISNADCVRALDADAVLLVAPDRLGVLHDVSAATRAATAEGLLLSHVLLVAPEQPDTSTGANASELPHVTTRPLVGVIAREEIAVTAARPELSAFLREVSSRRRL
jgi:dethiobiotin synthetase